MDKAGRIPCLFASAVLAIFAGRDVTAQTAQGNVSSITATPSNAPAPAYDVVTIRPNHQGPGSVHVSISLDLYNATNVSLVDLLRSAYHLRPGQLQGQPKWADDDRFDIRAKTLDVPADVLKKLTPEDRERMLRDLLADRFHVQVHTETRALPVFELVLAKGGTTLQPVAAEHRADAFHGVSPGGLSVNNGDLVGHYLQMDRFSDFLSNQVERVVLDKTGLTGYYNFQLHWTRDDQPANDDASAAPPLPAALEQQLGLHLVPAKEPVPVIVVDRADLPSEN